MIRSEKGLACATLTTQSPEVVGTALQQVVAHLEASRPFALTARQGEQIGAMIKYFQGGDVEDFRQASIAWVRDRADSRVDFMLGWVEFEVRSGDLLRGNVVHVLCIRAPGEKPVKPKDIEE